MDKRDEEFLRLADERTRDQYEALQSPGVCADCGEQLKTATPEHPGSWCVNPRCRCNPASSARDTIGVLTRHG